MAYQTIKDKLAEKALFTFLVSAGIIFLSLYAIYVSFFNLFGFKVISNYGFAQYTKNIVHLHDDSYVILLNGFKLYEDKLNVADLENPAKVKLTLKRNQVVRVKGYSRTENLTYVAVQLYKGTEKIYGYILIPKNIEYDIFSIDNQASYLQEKKLKDYKQKNRNQYLEKVNQSIKISKEKIPLNIEKLKQSDDFKSNNEIIDDEDLYPKPKEGIVYVSKDGFAELKKLHELYFDKDHEVDFIQYIP